MKKLQDILDRTAKSLESFTHPRVSVAWQDLNLVFQRVYNPSADLPIDIVGRKLEDFMDKKRAKELSEVKRRVIETGQPYQKITTVVLGGKKHIFDVSVEPTYDRKGKMDGLISINIDVTDLEEARARLHEANYRLVNLLDEALGDGPTVPRARFH